MINLLPSSGYDQDVASQIVWKKIDEVFKDDEGFCYYKDTLIASNSGTLPELVVYSRANEPLIVRCLAYKLEEINEVVDDVWVINNEEIDSPVLEMDDFEIKLRNKFDEDRVLRQKLKVHVLLALPLISKADFLLKFGDVITDVQVLWGDFEQNELKIPLTNPLDDLEWRVLSSIAQGIRPLRTGLSGRLPTKKKALGEVVRELEKHIALFDIDQESAAKKIAPGIQRIRGLAGTGKTVLLAMRAAEIHRRYPDKKILFTFNTQSLYNQARKLITNFYRFRASDDPNWEMLHIRHAWGGRNRPGVYYDLCGRQGTTPLTLNDVKHIRSKSPFQICCESALTNPILPEYDFILVDEAQDFPNEFFQILRRLAFPPFQICYAYDELQSIYSWEIPKTEDMFGLDENGKPYVVFDGEDYPGNIEKEFILNRSYRCPQPVLMLAHAIGLGIYSPYGCVQMLDSENSWNALGYELRSGKLTKGENVELFRPPTNSPNQVAELYDGEQPILLNKEFSNRLEELEWIATSIVNDIRVEKVSPEDIIVISLDSRLAKNYMSNLQMLLVQQNIASNIPGLVDDTAAFMESGKVTLSTINRAKGNESPIVYIMSFDALYDYVDSIENRNRAFTSISRSKAWVRITGVGPKMKQANNEISKIRADYPWFKFIFPDMDAIRRLDSETAKRRKKLDKGKASLAGLLNLDKDALAALIQTNPKLFEELSKKLEEAKREHK